jgi:hypothetical protein
MAVFWIVAPHRLEKFTGVLKVLPASIIRAMMEAASTTQTSIKFKKTTPRNSPARK